jgi:hypothetical protein
MQFLKKAVRAFRKDDEEVLDGASRLRSKLLEPNGFGGAAHLALLPQAEGYGAL